MSSSSQSIDKRIKLSAINKAPRLLAEEHDSEYLPQGHKRLRGIFSDNAVRQNRTNLPSSLRIHIFST